MIAVRGGVTARWWITNGATFKLLSIQGVDDKGRRFEIAFTEDELTKLDALRSADPDNPYGAKP